LKKSKKDLRNWVNIEKYERKTGWKMRAFIKENKKGCKKTKSERSRKKSSLKGEAESKIESDLISSFEGNSEYYWPYP